MCIAIAPSHINQLGNYTNWLTKRNLHYKVLSPGESLRGCTMLLLCGGPDVGTARQRDDAEIKWFKEAYGNIPVLGVCRGLQISNVILGGTLYDNLDEKKIKHTSNKIEIAGEPSPLLESSWHDVVFNDGTRFKVNSRHHQGIDRLADGLRIIAKCSEDEVLEMVEGDKALFVQWHPEREDVWGTDAEEVVYNWLKLHYKESTVPHVPVVDNPKQKIGNYLRSKGFTTVSNDRIRKSIDPSYSDDFLYRLIQENRFEMKRVTDKNGLIALKFLKL
jgi:GMP synthase-like glutamine amidotransferase